MRKWPFSESESCVCVKLVEVEDPHLFMIEGLFIRARQIQWVWRHCYANLQTNHQLMRRGSIRGVKRASGDRNQMLSISITTFLLSPFLLRLLADSPGSEPGGRTRKSRWETAIMELWLLAEKEGCKHQDLQTDPRPFLLEIWNFFLREVVRAWMCTAVGRVKS